MNENASPPAPSLPQPKNGIPALGWVGIGCGTLLIIAIIVISLLIGWCKRTIGDISDFQKNPEKAAAEMMVRMNPDIKKISQNDALGEMTIRTKDGKEMTMRYKDIADGKFMITDTEGNIAEFGGTDLSKVPAWVPRVPDEKNSVSTFHKMQGQKITGLYSAATTKSPDALNEYFKAEAEKLGFTSKGSDTAKLNGVERQILNFKGGGKTLNIVITTKPGEDTRVSVGYEEEK